MKTMLTAFTVLIEKRRLQPIVAEALATLAGLRLTLSGLQAARA